MYKQHSKARYTPSNQRGKRMSLTALFDVYKHRKKKKKSSRNERETWEYKSRKPF